MKLLSSVYRLQINEHLTLKKVLNLLPYLNDLGIDGIYCSPLFEAMSDHGYDILNPNHLNPKIGTMEDFEALCTELKKRDMQLVLDIVPNHMSIKDKANKWFFDVLEKGPSSPYASFFDIDWSPQKQELRNKVHLPLLGDSYGESLFDQKIQLVWEEGDFWIAYSNYKFPLNPESYAFLFACKPESEKSLSSKDASDFLECLHIAKECEKNKQKVSFRDLYERSEWTCFYFQELMTLMNGKKGEHQSFDLLHELLERQFYRLSHFLTAGQEINYRRFFNINELIAIHMEKEEVLNAHHALVFQWIKEGKVQGLRIDHPDGLYDPVAYFTKIRLHNPSFIVIEKILDFDESLSPTWQVEGTVGYEFLNILNGLFIQKDHESQFSKIYDQFIGHQTDFDLLLYERKKSFIKRHMGSEINALGWQLDQLSETSRYYRDFTRVDLTEALQEIIACFPVYRTYIRPKEEVSQKDKEYIRRAVEIAKSKNAEISPLIYDYIRDFLLEELKNPSQDGTDFILRFQQQTAPVMAKGLEDSTFYIFNRFIALNEVGGNPCYFGTSKSEFHQFNREKLASWPLGFLPSSTHDTKFSEDARLRLDVLSEIPQKWEAHIKEWEKENRIYKKKIHDHFFPDFNAEYYLYQMLLAIWPDDHEISPNPLFFERLWNCFLKSLREAGIYTNWLSPNIAYETCAKEFLSSILSQETYFYSSFIAFHKEISRCGRLNALSSLILRVGSCGIVDLYQGTEWWNYSLMDPDNRRPVDYDFLQKQNPLPDEQNLKLWATRQALHFRKQHKELFLEGEYIPLTIQNEKKEHIVAFLRKKDDHYVLIAAGRFFTQLDQPPNGAKCFGNTEILLPKHCEIKTFQDIFTKKTVHVHKKDGLLFLHAADLFSDFSFATLTSGQKKSIN